MRQKKIDLNIVRINWYFSSLWPNLRIHPNPCPSASRKQVNIKEVLIVTACYCNLAKNVVRATILIFLKQKFSLISVNFLYCEGYNSNYCSIFHKLRWEKLYFLYHYFSACCFLNHVKTDTLNICLHTRNPHWKWWWTIMSQKHFQIG